MAIGEKTNKIAAGIVLYNPDDLNRFMLCIHSIFKQFERVYIFDNSTMKTAINYPYGVIYCTEHANRGIAFALNRIMDLAEKDGYEWVVTMDQDSILPDGLVDAYEENIRSDDKIAIVCPQVIDVRRPYESPKTNPGKEYVNKCITSASCTSIAAWKKVGGFDEWLFIDLVDNEFCSRLIIAGYKLLKLNKFVLNQEFGKIIPKSERKQQFWIKLSRLLHNKNIAKFSYEKYVSAMRVYYTNRNIIYVNRKMKKYGHLGYESFNCNSYIGFLINFSVPSLLRAQEKRRVLISIIKGIRDGLGKKVEPWTYIA